VYVQVDGDLTWQNWWEGLRAGRVFVSNGPLLRCLADRQLPGHTFILRKANPLMIQLEGRLNSRDPIRAVEIVQNGTVIRSISTALDGQPHSLGQLRFEAPGWFLVRAIADESRTFRFASSGPFYVQGEDGARGISRKSAQFFLDWVHERMEKLQAATDAQREELLDEWRQAEKFWQEKLTQANAE